MTQEEAINELVLHAGFVLEEIEGFEEYGDGDPEMVEMNKKELEAFTIVLGALDSELATREGLKTRYKTLQGAYGFVEEEEPGEIETELYNLLKPWHEKNHTDFNLDDEENKILAIINKMQVSYATMKRMQMKMIPLTFTHIEEEYVFL